MCRSSVSSQRPAKSFGENTHRSRITRRTTVSSMQCCSYERQARPQLSIQANALNHSPSIHCKQFSASSLAHCHCSASASSSRRRISFYTRPVADSHQLSFRRHKAAKALISISVRKLSLEILAAERESQFATPSNVANGISGHRDSLVKQ